MCGCAAYIKLFGELLSDLSYYIDMINNVIVSGKHVIFKDAAGSCSNADAGCLNSRFNPNFIIVMKSHSLKLCMHVITYVVQSTSLIDGS